MKVKIIFCIISLLSFNLFAADLNCGSLFSYKNSLASTEKSEKPKPVVTFSIPKQVRSISDSIDKVNQEITGVESSIKAIDFTLEPPSGLSHKLKYFWEPSLHLSKKEIEKKEDEKVKLKLKLSELRDRKQYLIKQKNISREPLIKSLELFSKSPMASAAVESLLSYHSLYVIPKKNKVTLLVGGSHKQINLLDLVEIEKIVYELLARQYLVVFDAESVYASHLSKLLGSNGIPIFAKSSLDSETLQNNIVINNDYLRMRAFSESELVITTPHSVAGLGLMLEGQITHVLDTSGKFEVNSISDWSWNLFNKKRDLGVKFNKPQVVRAAVDTLSYKKNYSFVTHKLDEVREFIPFKRFEVRDLSADSIIRIGEEATSYVNVLEQNRGLGGSVFFGSSRLDDYSAPLIYESAYQLGLLGYAVATGGSGGAMEVANSGAYNSGAISIGVPLGGKSSLATELEVSKSIQTNTISTTGYEERIPILLGDGKDSRKIIVVAPGGAGTIKEFAVSLVRANGKLDDIKQIVFLDSDYYGQLFDWIQKSAISPEIKEKIVLIDSSKEMRNIGLKYQVDLERSRQQEPRKNQPEYIKPPKKDYKHNLFKLHDDYEGSGDF